MTTKTIKELTVPIPCYAERFLSTIAVKTGLDENEIALFFLRREAYHAQFQHAPKNKLNRFISQHTHEDKKNENANRGKAQNENHK